jgi:hypothetical protein
MDSPNEQFLNTRDEHQEQHTKPNVQRIDDDHNAKEKDLKRNFLVGGAMKNANSPGMEGEGMGGHKFGGDSHPPTGDDPANPSRNAGYSNAYFSRTEPMEEHPENNNFKDPSQQGEPDYHVAKPNIYHPNGQDADIQDNNNSGIAGPGEKCE